MVIRIFDGDTIVVQAHGHPETVKLIGVDTPEIKDPRKPVEYFDKEASHFTQSLLTGQTVRMEIQKSPSSRDKYGRLLAFVFRQSDKETARINKGKYVIDCPKCGIGCRASYISCGNAFKYVKTPMIKCPQCEDPVLVTCPICSYQFWEVNTPK
jgi:hypothetical protein